MKPLFQIKICGITTPNDARVVCNAGADAIGLNFFSGSSRYVNLDKAIEISRAVEDFNLKLESSPNQSRTCRVLKIGVFVNAAYVEILKSIVHCGLDAVQLHGTESVEFASLLRELLKTQLRDCRVLKAIRVESTSQPIESNDLNVNRVETLQTEIDAWVDSGADGILIDAAAPGMFGGSGETIDWSVVPRLNSSVPITLAGGLNPDNVAEAIRISGVASVDVASGVESSPGVKDEALVRRFVGACRLRSSSWSSS